MRRAGALLLLLASFALLPFAAAQMTLSVNGYEVDGLTLSLVEGVSYAPGAAFAEALGASLFVDYGTRQVTLELGGRALILPAVDSPSQGAESVPMRLNGQSMDGRPAVFWEGQLYLPVTPLAEAFLGYVSFVPERQRVVVVLARGRIGGISATQRASSERLVVDVTVNAPYSYSYNSALNSLDIWFDRASLESPAGVEGGEYFGRASLTEEGAGARLRVSLRGEAAYRVYTVPSGRGFELVVDLFERSAAGPAPVSRRVVIDPAHGGEDHGMESGGRSESSLALVAAGALAAELERSGLDVTLTRESDHSVPLATRAGLAVDSDIFLSLHVHEAASEVSIYYLAEADGVAGLEMAIRRNARQEIVETTDSLRRRLLLNLIPDIDVGRRYAQELRLELSASSAARVAEPQPAPLAVLAGAAGRGLLIELPAPLAEDDEFMASLAGAIAELLVRQEAMR